MDFIEHATWNTRRYDALLSADRLTLAAYDKDGAWIEADMDDTWSESILMSELYLYLPALMLLMARDCAREEGLFTRYAHFARLPSPDEFVRLHSKFFLGHKGEEYRLLSEDLCYFEPDWYRPIEQRLLADAKLKRASQEAEASLRRRFNAQDFSDVRQGPIKELCPGYRQPPDEYRLPPDMKQEEPLRQEQRELLNELIELLGIGIELNAKEEAED